MSVSRKRAPDPAIPAVEVRPTYAHVSGAALAHNLRTVTRHVGAATRVLAVVKADAYGHGAAQSAHAFVEAGAFGLGVSLVEEGVELREAGVPGPLVVLGGVHPGSEDVIVHRRLTPVVWSVRHLELVSDAVRRAGARPLPVHLKVDTGMSRLGVLPADLSAVLDWLAADDGDTVDFEGFMTHLACADEPADEVTTARQLSVFRDCLATTTARGLEPRLRHVCNSAGLVRFPSAHMDMVRPGIALYGSGSSAEVKLEDLQQAMSVHSRVHGVRELPAGARISYGGQHTLTRDSRLAIVPVGYGDGYVRGMTGQAEMIVRGHRCAVLGNITMDTSMVDVTDLPDLREGEQVTLLGTQGRSSITVQQMAGWAGVIPYEVTCGLSKRVPRRFTPG